MKTATLTILSRLLAMALGALGLGAFAALPASAQEIPAPDLFDGQVACSMNVPTPPMTLVGKDKDGMDIGITAKIADKTAIALTPDTDANPGVPTGDDAGLADILYVIDPHNSNCGAGTYSEAEVTALDAAAEDGDSGIEVGDPKPVAAGVAADVGAGYSDTLAKFMAKNMADAAEKTAQDALDALLEDELDDAGQTVQITAAREALVEAQAASTKADTALYATGAGPINMAGIAEWRAKGAVEAAIAGWNKAVGDLEMAGNDANLQNLAYDDKYVAVDSDQLLALFDGDGNVNLVNLRQYANVDGSNASTQADDGTITGDSAFDGTGKLILPMELWDHDDDSDTDMVLRVNPEDSSTFTAVNTRRNMVNAEVKLLEKLATDNQNTLLQPVIDEALKRAKVEQAHYQGQFDAMIADNTDLEPLNNDADDANDTDSYSIASRYAAYKKAETTRDNAGVTLETAVQAREAATADVRTAFTSPQDFYQQLVDRRSLVKDRADAEVTRLAGLTGDDAPSETATEAAAKAATDAQTALEAAEEIQASFQGLLADDSPVADLVLETLKPDAGMGAGDDGQALVDAIIGVNDTAGEAKTTADNAKATADTVAAAVAGLTGDEGAVSANTAAIAANDTEIAELDGRVTQNEEDIVALDGRVSDNEADIEALDGRVTQNESDIADNTAAIAVNAGMIVTNAGNIATNATNIMTNATDIATNAADIETNATDIMTNAGNIAMNNMYIMENRGMIETNAAGIGANAADIMAVRGMAQTNAAGISTNAANIHRNSESIDMLRAGVAASMALAGMPEIGDRGVSVGAGSYDGESALAVGVHFSGENSRFKLGVTSADGETGVSLGAGWSF